MMTSAGWGPRVQVLAYSSSENSNRKLRSAGAQDIVNVLSKSAVVDNGGPRESVY